MTTWQAPPEALRTVPEWQFYTTPNKVFPIAFDASPFLAPGQTATAAKVICTDAMTGKAVNLGTPVLVGNLVTFVVGGTGKALTRGHIYDIEINFTVSATDKPSFYCTVICS
jgi:hypothetical protein